MTMSVQSVWLALVCACGALACAGDDPAPPAPDLPADETGSRTTFTGSAATGSGRSPQDGGASGANMDATLSDGASGASAVDAASDAFSFGGFNEASLGLIDAFTPMLGGSDAGSADARVTQADAGASDGAAGGG